MWRGDVPTERNPMELVCIRDAGKRVRKPRSLTVEQFQLLLAQFERDLCFRTMLLLSVSFGLGISEVLGLKWCDVDWLGKTLRIERGIVKQIRG
jgi:integrase